MKFRNLLKLLLGVVVLSIFASCKTEATLEYIPNVVVSVAMPNEIKDNVYFANKTVTLRSQRLTYTVETNADGEALFKNIVPDIYSIYASWDLSSDEYAEMANSVVAPKPALISGIQSKMKIFNQDSIQLSTLLSVKQSLLISKVYASGTLDNNNLLYDADPYIEIFNNSDEIQYMDSVYLALVEGDNPMGFPAALFPTTIHARQLYRFPGTGKQYPVSPGKSVVICNSAVNHSEDVPTSVDLRQADFEFKGDKFTNNDAVTPMVLIYSSYLAIKEINLQRNGVNSVCIFKTKDDVSSYPIDYIPGKTSGNRFIELNSAEYKENDVFDGVEIIKYKATGSPDINTKRLQNFIDAGYTNISNTSGKNHESSDRKVDKKRSTATRIYLQDTNNSQSDFVTVTDPTPKKYDKPLLLQ
jgi:hypothetical protein